LTKPVKSLLIKISKNP